MAFIYNIYDLIKTIVCTYEPNAVENFAEFDAIINALF